MKKISLIHTKQCKKLFKKWDENNFCRGNMGCGFSTCGCDKIEISYKCAHMICEDNYKEKLISGQVPDGKSSAYKD